MKVQNLAIIFLVIIIPLFVILSYYLNLQQETLEKQALYDTKLAEATKEGIKAFEVNTVDWTEWVNQKTKVSERNDVKAAINAFITSLSNNLNVSGTAKEFMVNYIPAVVVTMYDGYYIYSPTYSPIPILNDDGAQLYYDSGEKILTTDTNNGANLPAYKPKAGETGKTAKNDSREFVTSITRAEKEYKHTLSSLIQYVEQYKNANANVIVNYTLDNRIYINGTVGGETVKRDGYLVYFDSNKTELPRITLKTNPQNSNDITVKKKINETLYENTQIEPEILEEQVIYFENGQTYLDTFKYIYDINDDKLYYDENEYEFFQLTADKVRDYKDDDPETKYKSLSVLLRDGKTTQYKKIYQALNGEEKGQWYISLKDDSADAIYEGKEELDTRLEGSILSKLGLSDSDSTSTAEICKDYSAINYYVEAYAFTNWVENILGNTQVYNEEKEIEERIFNITAENDPEEEYSPINEHKRRIMKAHIIKNLEISKYKIPQLTYNDWDQVFSNISIITFFQGPSIGLKYYNNYAIATSKTNREFVDPQEIYFRSSGDKNYHIVNCEKCGNTTYTGYRSVEYVLRENILYDSKYYYQHDKQTDSSAETACYYCVVNKANYQSSSNEEIAALQTKAYREALARERYFQKEQVLDKVNTDITIAVKKSEISIKNTDIIFILDDSGSMSAESINAVQEACSDIIDAMRLSENFYIGFIRFDSNAEKIASATNQTEFDTLKTKINEIYGGSDRGSTNYEGAFNVAKELLSDEFFLNRTNKRIIVFMTDGKPDEGKSGEEVLKDLRDYHSYNVEEFYAIKFGDSSNDSLEKLVKVFKYNYDPATDINILNADTTNILDTFKNILYSVNISSPEYIETKDGRLNLNDMDLSSEKPLNITVKKNGIALAPNPLVITQIETSNEVLIVEAGTIYLNLKGIQNVFGLDNFDGIEVEIEYYSKS